MCVESTGVTPSWPMPTVGSGAPEGMTDRQTDTHTDTHTHTHTHTHIGISEGLHEPAAVGSERRRPSG